MKRIDLLIQLVKNIHKLLKTNFEAPCSCTVLASNNKEVHLNQEEVNSIVQILRNIEEQVHVSNKLAIDHYYSNAEVCQPKKPEAIQEVLMRQQVIDILKISERTYYRHIENGILVPCQLGNRNYFYHSDLIEALEYSKIHGYL